MRRAIDILQWLDGFWCFREELHPAMLRDYNYRLIAFESEEWREITVQRSLSTYPSSLG